MAAALFLLAAAAGMMIAGFAAYLNAIVAAVVEKRQVGSFWAYGCLVPNT
jgi:hypothetical protein